MDLSRHKSFSLKVFLQVPKTSKIELLIIACINHPFHFCFNCRRLIFLKLLILFTNYLEANYSTKSTMLTSYYWLIYSQITMKSAQKNADMERRTSLRRKMPTSWMCHLYLAESATSHHYQMMETRGSKAPTKAMYTFNFALKAPPTGHLMPTDEDHLKAKDHTGWMLYLLNKAPYFKKSTGRYFSKKML